MAADVTPINYATPVGRVRKYIPDIVQLPDPRDPAGAVSYMWSDDAINSFLADVCDPITYPTPLGFHIMRAAGDIMVATANDEVLIMKKIKTEDLETDGPAVSRALISGAEKLYARAALEEANTNGDIFIEVEYNPRWVDYTYAYGYGDGTVI